MAHGLCSSGLFCLSDISYELFGRRSLLVNKGLMNLTPEVGTDRLSRNVAKKLSLFTM